MTTKPQTFAPLPDPPERTPEDMTNFNQTNITGNAHYLMDYLGHADTTLVAGEHYLARTRPNDLTGVRYPDLLVAFDVNPEAYYRSNAYIIDEQGKPPDFVLEIASPSTSQVDATTKFQEYEALGITEYWRFDEKPTSNRPKLAGDRLTDGKYVPIPIDEPAPGISQGYSQALGLLICWEEGQLRWLDPRTGESIPTIHTERQGRMAERQGRLSERQGRMAERQDRLDAEKERDTERQGRMAERQGRLDERQGRLDAERERDAERDARLNAEAQIRQLQAELERRNSGA